MGKVASKREIKKKSPGLLLVQSYALSYHISKLHDEVLWHFLGLKPVKSSKTGTIREHDDLKYPEILVLREYGG